MTTIANRNDKNSQISIINLNELHPISMEVLPAEYRNINFLHEVLNITLILLFVLFHQMRYLCFHELVLKYYCVWGLMGLLTPKRR